MIPVFLHDLGLITVRNYKSKRSKAQSILDEEMPKLKCEDPR